MIAHVPVPEDREMLANQARTVADEYLAIAAKTTDLLAK